MEKRGCCCCDADGDDDRPLPINHMAVFMMLMTIEKIMVVGVARGGFVGRRNKNW